MSWDIAMCVEGSSCSTWRAEWCEQEVTRGFAVCGALLALLQPGTPTYLWFQFNGIIKDSLSGPLSAVLVVFAWGWPWLRGWLWRPQIRLLMSCLMRPGCANLKALVCEQTIVRSLQTESPLLLSGMWAPATVFVACQSYLWEKHILTIPAPKAQRPSTIVWLSQLSLNLNHPLLHHPCLFCCWFLQLYSSCHDIMRWVRLPWVFLFSEQKVVDYSQRAGF